MERLNFNQLFYFYVVATEGSVKAACEKLHLTQPTISGQLKTLEEDLGYQLFDRKYRRLELNEQGKTILSKAEKIFVLGDELLSSLPAERTRVKNEVRIGVVMSMPNSLVHDFTLGIWSDPNVSAKIVHGEMSELIKFLDEDKVDLILSDTPYARSRNCKSINIGRQKLVAVGTDRFSDAKADFPNSLSGLPYLSFDKRGHIQEEIDFFFKMNNISPASIGSVDDDAFIRLVVSKGICFSVLPELSVQEMIQSNSLIKIGELTDIISSGWVILSHFGSQRSVLRKLLNNYLINNRQAVAS